MSDRTLLICKPDAVERGLADEILSRVEGRGLRLVARRNFMIDEELAARHYGEHAGKPFYGELISFITSGPVVAVLVEGPDAVAAVRDLMGPTDPSEAPKGTIRGDYGKEITRNLVHGSDSPESAEREIRLFFPDPE